MTFLTENETYILRFILGLHKNNRDYPTRNRSHGLDKQKYKQELTALEERGYLKKETNYGPSGREYFYKATESGQEAVKDQSWK